VDGVRLLLPDTLTMMASTRLTDHQRATSKLLGLPLFASGHGYGMGVAVVMEPDKRDPMRLRRWRRLRWLAGSLWRLVAGRSKLTAAY